MSAATQTDTVKAFLSGAECTFNVLVENPPHQYCELPDLVRVCADPTELYLVSDNHAQHVKNPNRYNKKRRKLNGAPCYLCELQ